MANNNKCFGFLMAITISLVFPMLTSCGGFGGRYKIESLRMDAISTDAKIPLNVRLVLSSELCNYTYTSVRQGAKRVYELGDALCTNNRKIFSDLFKNVIVVSSKDEGKTTDFDVTAILKVIDTSVLIRPGAPPQFEATIIYECAIEDRNGRTIFVRTIKEYKVIKRYGYDSYRIVMQDTVDELFTKLGHELIDSLEIKKFATQASQVQ